MYDFLRGTVVAIDPTGRLSLDVNGVGYALRVSEQTRRTIPLDGRPVTLHVRLQVKEDDLVLFGFADHGERAAFDLLLSVQGVGPAVGLAVLSHLGVSELQRALTVRDVKALTAVKGVGSKTAERIILELADKAERLPGAAPAGEAGRPVPVAAALGEAQRALLVLGYGAKEAAAALAQVHRHDLAAEDLVRAALGRLR